MTAAHTRVAVVTGGTRGIGRACCAALGRAGYHVFALGRTAPAEVLPAHTHFLPCDVADPASVQGAFAAVQSIAGGMDVLVNNAGVAGSDPLEGIDESLWQAIVDTNLSGAYRCTRAALPLMAGRQGGRIVFVSSVLGLRGAPDQVAYTAAKHGVVGLARAFALALAGRGITANAVCPGWVETDMAQQRFDALGIDAAGARAGVPTGALLSPEEVAATVMYLVGDAARNFTGQALVIDGGTLASP